MKKLIVLSSVLLPVAAFATGTVDSILLRVIGWVKLIVPVLITIAIGFFIWGVIQYISASDEEAKKLGRTRIINGLIGMFVIVAFWGIIAVVQNTFGIESSSTGIGEEAIIPGDY